MEQSTARKSSVMYSFVKRSAMFPLQFPPKSPESTAASASTSTCSCLAHGLHMGWRMPSSLTVGGTPLFSSTLRVPKRAASSWPCVSWFLTMACSHVSLLHLSSIAAGASCHLRHTSALVMDLTWSACSSVQEAPPFSSTRRYLVMGVSSFR